MAERVERAAQAPNATRRFSHEHLAQADQKLPLKNLFRSNLRSKNGLGSNVSVPEQSCPSHETNLPTTEKSRAFMINRASVPDFQAISGGHAAALKVFSFLGLSPISKNSRAEQTCIPPEKYSVFPPRTA